MKVYNVKLRRWEEEGDFELEPELSETYIELMRRVNHFNQFDITYKIRLLQDGSIDVFEPFVEWFRFTGMPPPPGNGFYWSPVAAPKPSADNPVIHIHEGAG